jgi:hypothetical protein
MFKSLIIMTTLEPSQLLELPPELLLPILNSLNLHDLLQVTAVNFELRQMCSDVTFWQTKFRQEGLPLEIPTTLDQWVHRYQRIKHDFTRARVIWQHLREGKFPGLDDIWITSTRQYIRQSPQQGIWFSGSSLIDLSILALPGVPYPDLKQRLNNRKPYDQPKITLNYLPETQWSLELDGFQHYFSSNSTAHWTITSNDALMLLYHLIRDRIRLYHCRGIEINFESSGPDSITLQL